MHWSFLIVEAILRIFCFKRAIQAYFYFSFLRRPVIFGFCQLLLYFNMVHLRKQLLIWLPSH
jgi:hypothetical protein